MKYMKSFENKDEIWLVEVWQNPPGKFELQHVARRLPVSLSSNVFLVALSQMSYVQIHPAIALFMPLFRFAIKISFQVRFQYNISVVNLSQHNVQKSSTSQKTTKQTSLVSAIEDFRITPTACKHRSTSTTILRSWSIRFPRQCACSIDLRSERNSTWMRLWIQRRFAPYLFMFFQSGLVPVTPQDNLETYHIARLPFPQKMWINQCILS